MRLLLAEDTQDLNKAIATVLRHYNYEVDCAFDGEEALTYLKRQHYEAVILDIMMPKKDGIAVLQDMRSNDDMTPVLLLTAKAEVDDRVTGLDAGADDYLVKPFAMKELLARIRSLTRRNDDYDRRDVSVGNVTLNVENEELSSLNSIRLSHKECELFKELALHKNPLDTKYLFEKIWKGEEVSEDTIWLYISYLKGKLQSINANITIAGERGGSFQLVNNEQECD